MVIGAGIGGLSTALRLSHAGLSVRVVDLHDAPGGKMRVRASNVGPIDIGPTVLTMRNVFDDLFADIGAHLSDHVTLVENDILARHFWPDGGRLDLCNDLDRNIDAIAAFAGRAEAHAFRRFANRAKRLFEAFEYPMMRAPVPNMARVAGHVLRRPDLLGALSVGRTLARRLADDFKDPRLQQLFGRYATYVGGSPYQSPALLSLIWHAEACGVWRVMGGMHALARAMHTLAKDKGVTFQFNARATRIECQDGRVSAVHMADGGRLPADVVVFNGDPKALVEGHLGPASRGAVPPRGIFPRSLSACVWGFAARAQGVDLAHHNVFFCANPKAEFDDLAAGRIPHDGTLYLCAQDRGQNTQSSLDCERFEIILNGPAGHIATQEDKIKCQTRAFRALKAHGLRFSPPPGPEALTTPQDFATAFPGSDGSLYGRSPHGMMAALHRPTAKTRLAGLYLCGGGAHPGAGVPMACLSGAHAAAAILNDLALPLTFRPMAMPGGMSTGSATTAPGQFQSSGS